MVSAVTRSHREWWALLLGVALLAAMLAYARHVAFENTRIAEVRFAIHAGLVSAEA